eukprot:5568493-Prymnesium_polylepis.2
MSDEDPSLKSTVRRSELVHGTPIGASRASSEADVNRGSTMSTDAPEGLGRFRCKGRVPVATGVPQTVQLTKTGGRHSAVAPTATPTCQKLSAPLGCINATLPEPLDTSISSMFGTALYPTSSSWPSA